MSTPEPPSTARSASQHTLRFDLNGTPREITVPANVRLLDLLRDDLGLTGTKEGCGVGSAAPAASWSTDN
jgi:aerobic-type carbon monoxide dehydrogenase small subunit (CoxS/CutS family)